MYGNMSFLSGILLLFYFNFEFKLLIVLHILSYFHGYKKLKS